MALEEERIAEPFQNTRCDKRGIGLVLDWAEEDCELVTANASHDGLPRASGA